MRKWLRDLRKNNNLTQTEAAELLGISQNHYCNIENGIRQAELTLSTAAKIADLFNISLSMIRNYEELLAIKRSEPK